MWNHGLFRSTLGLATAWLLLGSLSQGALPLDKGRRGSPDASGPPQGGPASGAGAASSAHTAKPVSDEPKPKPLVLTGPLAPIWQLVRQGALREAAGLATKLAPQQKTPALRQEAEALAGLSLRSVGKLDDAEKLLEATVKRDPMALDARVELGLCYRQRGARDEERAIWNQFFDEHDAGKLDMKSAKVQRLLGTAAFRLGSFHDANDTLRDAALLAKKGGDLAELSRINITWAELFLEKYRSDNADESLQDALRVDPENADALALKARVLSETSNRIGEIEALIQHALRLSPGHAGALALQAELLIDNEEYEAALSIADQAIAKNPTDWVAHSLRATALLLLERPAAYEAARATVLKGNPLFSTFYRLAAQRLVVQHRYGEVVQLLEQATQLEPKNYAAWAELGSGYLRLGQDDKGLSALRRAWKGDRFNQRTKNLLDLFEKKLAEGYVLVTLDIDPARPGTGGLRLRMPKEEQALLKDLIVPLVQKEWRVLQARYGFTPKVPLTLELFADPDDYAIRTVGLPGLAALGVTFGEVVTGRSPAQGNFNWALMIWHELSHVFAIQASRSRVPRWFTEGLSEWETTQERPEWVRRTHAEIYAALRDGALLSMGDLNGGFTRAQDIANIVVAYHEAALAIDYLVRTYGFGKIVEALRLFSTGKRTKEVLMQITGQSIAALDAAFQKDLGERLAAYRGTFFVRPSHYSDREGLDKQIAVLVEKKRRTDKETQQLARLYGLRAVGLVRSGGAQKAKAEIDADIGRALALDTGNKEALLAEAETLAKTDRKVEAETRFRALIAAGGDGFDVRFHLGSYYAEKGRTDEAKSEFAQAKKLDPDRSEPYEKLAVLYQKLGQADKALAELQAAARLDIMDAELAARVVEKTHQAGRWAEVVSCGELARHLTPYAPSVRGQIGEALLRLGKKSEAKAELGAAILATGSRDEADPAGKQGTSPAGSDGEPAASDPAASEARRKYQALLEEAQGKRPARPAPAQK